MSSRLQNTIEQEVAKQLDAALIQFRREIISAFKNETNLRLARLEQQMEKLQRARPDDTARGAKNDKQLAISSDAERQVKLWIKEGAGHLQRQIVTTVLDEVDKQYAPQLDNITSRLNYATEDGAVTVDAYRRAVEREVNGGRNQKLLTAGGKQLFISENVRPYFDEFD